MNRFFRRCLSRPSWLSKKHWQADRRFIGMVFFESIVSLTIATVSLRTFLFGKGLYLYSDQNWPIGGSAYPPGIFAPSVWSVRGAYLLQFTRDFVTWPYYLLRIGQSSSEVSEKGFILYGFCLFIAVSFVFANLLLRQLKRVMEISRSPIFEEAFKTCVVLVAFTNLDALNLNSNGGSFSGGLIVVTMAISLLAIVTWTDPIKSGVAAGILVSASILINPDYTFIFAATVGVAALARAGVSHGFRRYGTSLGVAFLTAFPVLLFMVYGIIRTYNPSGLTPDYRSFDLGSVRNAAQNLTPLNAFLLLGTQWSNMAFGPPTIIAYGNQVSNLSGFGSPTQVLLPPDALTIAWLACLFVLPLVSFFTLSFTRARSLAIPSTSVLLLGLVFTQYPWIPILDSAISALTSLPLIGQSIGTAFAIPDHFLQMMAAAYLILFPTGVYFIVGRLVSRTKSLRASSTTPFSTQFKNNADGSRNERDPKPPRRIHSSSKALLPLAMLVILVFPVAFCGWQAFNGSYYPARAYPPFNSPNNVPNAGAFSPKEVPADVSAVYGFIDAQPGLFNVFWPTGGANETDLGKATLFFTYADFATPELPTQALSYLISNKLTADIGPYLASLDIKYLVVQDSGPTILQSFYGDGNITDLLNQLDAAPGLSLAYHVGSVYAYEVSGILGYTYPASMLLNFPLSQDNYAIGYSVLESLGEIPAFTYVQGQGRSFSIDNSNSEIGIISPDQISNYTNNYPGVSEVLNGTDQSWNQTAGTYYLQNWGITNWGQTTITDSLQSGVLSLNAKTADDISVSYKGPLTTQAGGIIVPSPETQRAIIRLTFSYRTSPGSTGQILAYDVPLSSNLTVLGEDEQSFSLSSDWTRVSYTTQLPRGTEYFTARIFATSFSGALQIKDASMRWAFLDQRSDAAFGTVALFSNSTLTFPNAANTLYVQYNGNGTIY